MRHASALFAASGCLLATFAAAGASAQPLTTAFTYQGELRESGAPATGPYDVRFRLYDAASGGTQIGTVVCADNVAVSGGRFTVLVDFGAQFSGQQRFVEIDVRRDTGLACGNATGYTTLSGRIALTATPNAAFALAAGTATSATNATQLNGQPGSFYQNASNLTAGTIANGRLSAQVARLDTNQTFSGQMTFSNAANAFSGAFTGSGGGLTGLNAANIASGLLADARLSTNIPRLDGANTFSATTNTFVNVKADGWIGNDTDVPVELRSGGVSTMRLTSELGLPNVVGGSEFNSINRSRPDLPIGGVAIGGGGWNTVEESWTTIAGGQGNYVRTNFGTIGGGGPIDPARRSETNNRVYDLYGTVGGGGGNRAGSDTLSVGDAQFATVAGGRANEASGGFSSILGGSNNAASGLASAIAGGDFNIASAERAFVGGGNANNATGVYSTIAGGYNSFTSGRYNAIAGGFQNRATGEASGALSGAGNQATATYAVVSGGGTNTASGDYSAVGGGSSNAAPGFSSAVAGGDSNSAIGERAFIGGGNANAASGVFSSIAGGIRNVTGPGRFNTIAGGYENLSSGEASGALSGAGNDATATYAVVAGGGNNAATADYSGVLGGFGNAATGAYASVGGGVNNTSSGSYSTIAGGSENDATGFVATVAGGDFNLASGPRSFIGGGNGNITAGSLGVVAGGANNRASSGHAAVAGGQNNTASGDRAFVGGGSANTASGAGSVVAGGFVNTATFPTSVVGGGSGNNATNEFAAVLSGQSNQASGTNATVVGGQINTASGDFSSVVGGGNNIASGDWAAALGGSIARASGDYATTAGGFGNIASAPYSFAAGKWSEARHAGSFVWGDSLREFNTPTQSTGDNQFIVIAAGGVCINTTSPTIRPPAQGGLMELTVGGDFSAFLKFFRIDHPLDPANKELLHACVESDEYKNIYDGTVTTDARGLATVTMPDWFDALNEKFRYQLTVIDGSDDDFIFAKVYSKLGEDEPNRFTIKTSRPNVEVSWQLTGVRKDAYAKSRPMSVEIEKPIERRGTYLYPAGFTKDQTPSPAAK
jgi:hypothetical protein